MSMKVGKKIKKTAKDIATETKNVVKKPTDKGVAKIAVGTVASAPIAWAYNKAYDFLADRYITNSTAKSALKIALPLGLGALFHFGKLPAGEVVGGVGYGTAALSGISMLVNKLKGKPINGNGKKKSTPTAPSFSKAQNWGVF